MSEQETPDPLPPLFEPVDFDDLGIECGMPLTWEDRNISAKIAKHVNRLMGERILFYQLLPERKWERVNESERTTKDESQPRMESEGAGDSP